MLLDILCMLDARVLARMSQTVPVYIDPFCNHPRKSFPLNLWLGSCGTWPSCIFQQRQKVPASTFEEAPPRSDAFDPAIEHQHHCITGSLVF